MTTVLYYDQLRGSAIRDPKQLTVGKRILDCHVPATRYYEDTAGPFASVQYVIGEPFYEEYPPYYGKGTFVMVSERELTGPHAAYKDKLYTHRRFLSDAGVVPYVGDRSSFYNNTNFLLDLDAFDAANIEIIYAHTSVIYIETAESIWRREDDFRRSLDYYDYGSSW